jgi:D-arabinono-1,4-lactone oxidase
MSPTTPDHLPEKIRAAVQASADDGVPFRARTSFLHSTWARTYTSLPELYIRPQSEAEVEKAVRLAARCRRRVTTVGSGHSPSDLTCTSSWLVNLDDFKQILFFDRATGLVKVQAGIRLFQLGAELDRLGLAMPNLGSINHQSIAGVISTGTHGSTLQHGLVSEGIAAMRITLADGKTYACSPDERPELFRAALLSLGALGIITEVSFRCVPHFTLSWRQTIDAEARIFREWDKTLWTQADFVRVWWFPYSKRAAVWAADKVAPADLESGAVVVRDPPTSYYDSWLGYVVYHNLLYLSRWVPSILPWVERFVFGMQYGFCNGDVTLKTAVQPGREALLLNCLYSQFVNEWAIPLAKGPEALQRLGAWLGRLKPGDAGYIDHGIPFSAEGLWVHAPVEVRVADATIHTSAERNNRPWLDPTCKDGPTLYLNAIMYRPYLLDPPRDATRRYYEGFEWLMRDLGGKPHWAKNFSVSPTDIQAMYTDGDDLASWRKVRDESDPEGMFVGPWHRRHVLGGGPHAKLLPLEEPEFVLRPARDGSVRVTGSQSSASV